jgi:glycosyltransferase involved in cell wall biosynthesis
MKHNTLILTGIYPPDTGGPAKFVETFSNWCANIGEFTSVVSYCNSNSKVISSDTSNVILISRDKSIVRRYFLSITTILKLQKKMTAVIANGLFVEIAVARFISKFEYVAKVPGDIVWERARNQNITSLNIEEFQSVVLPFKLKIMRFLFSRSLKMASSVIVPSEQLRQLAMTWGVASEKIHVIYNSVDTNTFSPMMNTGKVIDVLTVCRLVPWKGLQELIEIVARNGLSLTIVGDGPERDKLKTLSAKINANVSFLGEVSQNLMPALYAKSTYFVLNSSFEATSYAMLEARSTGLVCVGNANTGSAEIIKHKVNGFVCDTASGFTLQDFFDFTSSPNFDYHQFSELSVSDTRKRFNLEINYREILELALRK